MRQWGKKNPTNTNDQKHKMAQNKVINACQKEQIEYIQGQIDKIRNSVGRKTISNSMADSK